MGILDDLAMGFGLKARTQDYDARTARNIAETQAFGDDPHAAHRARQNYKPEYTARYEAALNDPRGQAQKFLQRQGGEGYSPSIIPRNQDNRGFVQRALFSPQSDQLSPKPYAIGPVQLDGPLRIPGILGMITGGLFGQRDREVPTVSADGGPMRVRPSGYQRYDIPNSLTDDDMGLPDFSGPGDRLHRGLIEMDLEGQKYPSRADYLLRYGNDGLLSEPEPESLIPTPPSEEDLPELLLPRVDDPTYEEFMEHQKELEAKMGFDPVSEAQYRRMYNRLVTR